MGGNGVEKNRVQELLDSVFFQAPILESALDYPPATFQHKVLNTHLGGLKAAYIGSALSKFRQCWGWSNLVSIFFSRWRCCTSNTSVVLLDNMDWVVPKI